MPEKTRELKKIQDVMFTQSLLGETVYEYICYLGYMISTFDDHLSRPPVQFYQTYPLKINVDNFDDRWMHLKSKDADRMNAENEEMIAKRRSKIQSELADAVREKVDIRMPNRQETDFFLLFTSPSAKLLNAYEKLHGFKASCLKYPIIKVKSSQA